MGYNWTASRQTQPSDTTTFPAAGVTSQQMKSTPGSPTEFLYPPWPPSETLSQSSEPEFGTMKFAAVRTLSWYALDSIQLWGTQLQYVQHSFKVDRFNPETLLYYNVFRFKSCEYAEVKRLHSLRVYSSRLKCDSREQCRLFMTSITFSCAFNVARA